jgi:guanylate kinase
MIERGEFLEWADVYGHLYGTSALQVASERAEGRDIILEIDVQGAESIRRRVADAISIFILPPSFALLRNRLVARATDSAADLERRLQGAAAEVAQYQHFDYVILNDEINRASQQLAFDYLRGARASRKTTSYLKRCARRLWRRVRTRSSSDGLIALLGQRVYSNLCAKTLYWRLSKRLWQNKNSKNQ